MEFCEKNGIVLLTFPSHCSHKLQPLDVSVYGPLKTYYNAECGNWMKPGRKITLYEVSEILGKSYAKAFTLENATAGFQKTGIYPFNDDIFKEVDFLPSVAYRPIAKKDKNCQQLQLKQNLNEVENRNECLSKSLNKSFSNNIASSSTNSTCSSSTTIQFSFSPELVRHYPVVKVSFSNLQKRKSAEPIIGAENSEKNIRSFRSKSKKLQGAVSNNLLKFNKNHNDTESEDNISLRDDSDCDISSEDDDLNEKQLPNIGDFVLVKFEMKKPHSIFHYYVGKILDEDNEDNEFEVKFLKRIITKNVDAHIFSFPSEDDVAGVDKDDVVMILPKPYSLGTSSRCENQYRFPFNLSHWRIPTS